MTENELRKQIKSLKDQVACLEGTLYAVLDICQRGKANSTALAAVVYKALQRYEGMKNDTGRNK